MITSYFPDVKCSRSLGPVEEEEGEYEEDREHPEDLDHSTNQTPSRFLYKSPVLVYMRIIFESNKVSSL